MGVTFIQPGRFGAAFSPDDISGLVLWLDAENYSGSGATWPDTSGNALDATLVNSPTWGTHAGGRRMFTFNGSTQYATVADNALLDFGATDPFSLVVISQQASYAASDWVVGKKTSSAVAFAGYCLRNGSGTPAQLVGQFSDGTNGVGISTASRSNGALYLGSLTRNVGADQAEQYLDNTATTPVSDTTTATLANAVVLSIARDGSGGEYCAIDVLAVLLYSAVLTSGNISDLCTYYGTV